jgi:hypothetical protein
MSFSNRTFAMNQEDAKQERKQKKGLAYKVKDFLDDGELNNSVSEE